MLYTLWGFSQTDDRASYTRLMLHEMYAAKKIDLVFIGASPVYHGIDPAISDELLNCNTFNLGSSSQTLEDSYYLLKEAIRTHRNSIQTVVFHMSYVSISNEESEKASAILIRYFRPSLNRQLFAKTVFNDFFFSKPISLHAYGYDDEAVYLFRNFRLKLTDPIYRSYGYANTASEYERYAGKGYVVNTSSVPDGTMKVSDLPVNIAEGSRSEQYARKLIELCQKNGIRIILISVPYSDTRLLSLGDSYDYGHQYIAGIASEYGIPYWDFNLADSFYLPDDDSCYLDAQHLNQKGAERFTKLLCRILLEEEEGKNVDGYFCSTARQRILQTNTVRAIKLQAQMLQSENTVLIKATPLTSPEIEVEYRFELMRGEEIIDSTTYGADQTYRCAVSTDDLTIISYARRKGTDVAYDAKQTDTIANLLQEGT